MNWKKLARIGSLITCSLSLLVGVTTQAFAVPYQSLSSEYRNVHGLGWWQIGEQELRYAQSMGFKYVFLDQYYKNAASTYKKGLRFYYNDPHKNIRPLLNYSLTAQQLANYKVKYPATFANWPEASRSIRIDELDELQQNDNALWSYLKTEYLKWYAVTDTLKPFPQNLMGYRWGSIEFEAFYDFQQQWVIDNLVNRMKTVISQTESADDDFLFAGISIDVPDHDKEANYNPMTGGTTLLHDSITHQYTTLKEGWERFLIKLKNDLSAQYPTRSMKYWFEPYRVMTDWMANVNASSYSSTDKKTLMGDFLTSEAITDDFLNPQVTSSGILSLEDVGVSSPDFVPDAQGYVSYGLPLLGKAAINGRFMNWFGRPGPPGFKGNIPNLDDSGKLTRVLANWDNVNQVPLASRSWNLSTLTYNSTKSHADPHVIYTRRPETNMLYVHFLDSTGTVTLNAGESVAKAVRVNEYMEPTIDAGSDLTISGSTVSINYPQAYDHKTYILYLNSNSELLTNNSFENGSSNWYIQGSGTGTGTFVLDNPAFNSGYGAKVKSRTAVTDGISQDIKQGLLDNGKGQYTVSSQVRMLSGSDTVKLGVQLVDSTGTKVIFTNKNVDTSWTSVGDTLDIVWSGTLQSASFFIQTTSTTNSFDVDSASVKSTGSINLVQNGAMNEGSNKWFPSAGTVSAAANSTHSGNYMLRLTGRAGATDSLQQDVTARLTEFGQGTYTLSAWVRLVSGTDTGKLYVKWTDSGGTHTSTIFFGALSTGWTQLSGSPSLTWTGTLSSAKVYLETTNTNVDFYADDVYLSKSQAAATLDSTFESNSQQYWFSSSPSKRSYRKDGDQELVTTGRTANWYGPMQDITNMLATYGSGDYQLSFSARLASGTDTIYGRIKIVDINGTNYYQDVQLSGDTSWKSVSGTQTIPALNGLQQAYFMVTTASSTADLYVDEVKLTKSAIPRQLLTNNEFDLAVTGWVGNLSIDPTVYRGMKALKLYGRTNTWTAPAQDVTTILTNKGQGTYTLSAAVKLESATDTASVTLKLVDGSGTRYIRATGLASTVWNRISGLQSVTWTGTLTSATLLVETTASTDNLFIDDVSLLKN
ncbi:carbohydrate binding domain-containing protein [Paenibacillus roseipurpureus]|uniref:Carbohydrate binding domain-containing protein n=1 Tax=Paenibacillus roseopurpureus TaxID=2918901 RepID=A0AA96LUC1_9BACL|nr:carbohydrate binding domain-containing protein [Paenibacillus sp. MBLB1832]WNR46153.1 carbohydrate binding domain-containing protein [Paenibacillus sp. MBLB1832]